MTALCEVCDHNVFHEIAVAREYTDDQPLHVCMNCGMVQVITRRSAKEIYEDWIGQSPGDDVYLSADAAVAARHAYVARFVDFGRNPQIIDIGSGDGAFEGELFWSSASVESWHLMAEDIEDADYDFATILWTLENCGNANAVIEAAHRATKDDGYVVVATGSRIMVPFKKPLNCYLGPAPLDLHPWRFSANTLVNLLARHGFKTVETNRYIDSDYLVVVARKTSEKLAYPVDDYKKVLDFFTRWHKESQHYN